MVFLIIGQRKKITSLSSSSTSSRLSASRYKVILDNLKNSQNRVSTRNNYYGIWKKFNEFVIKLDRKPSSWEDRFSLYGAHLVESGAQSSTIRSYASAVKAILINDGYEWNDQKVLLNTIIKACKLVNDTVKTRLPIGCNLLELILMALDRSHASQPYLCLMYKAILLLGYYGLMCVGELTTGSHPVKAKDIHIGMNKDKILIVLYSSKTHGKESRPQKIKIHALINADTRERQRSSTRHYCPSNTLRQYLHACGTFESPMEPLFVFWDGRLVTPEHVRVVLWGRIDSLNLDPLLYDTHSLRIGRASDMFHKFNFSVEEIKQKGRWSSNAVYKYLRT